MGNGFPIAAIAGQEEVMMTIEPGSLAHGGTYSGNVVGAAAADATLDLIENQLEQFEKTHKEFCEKASSECNEAGGNDVSTIRDISLARLKTKEFVTKLQIFLFCSRQSRFIII